MKAIEALKEFLASQTDDYSYEFGYDDESTYMLEHDNRAHFLQAVAGDGKGNLFIYLSRTREGNAKEIKNDEQLAKKVLVCINKELNRNGLEEITL